jgi:hypothetical protein
MEIRTDEVTTIPKRLSVVRRMVVSYFVCPFNAAGVFIPVYDQAAV